MTQTCSHCLNDIEDLDNKEAHLEMNDYEHTTEDIDVTVDGDCPECGELLSVSGSGILHPR